MTTTTDPVAEPFARTDRAPRSRRRLAFVHGGSHFHLQTLKDPAVIAHQPEFVYLGDLADWDLDAFDTVVLADRLHPELVRKHTAQLLAVPQRGGTLVVLGENAAHTWLPGVSWSPRPTNFWWWLEGSDPLIRTRNPEHEAWEYLSTKSVIWHHHGLLHNEADVVPLVVAEEPDETGARADAGAILYEDTVSTPGRIIATTLDPTYHHGNNFMPGSTRFLYSLLRWLDNTGS
ncbi:hypothetical protein BJF87_08750 [Gordonia sp. CNJ-863]|uniref:hypothetical protein n=1 Tax=Gordonia sp. CNJ-863 TaxID=1904963 RepID=UPI00095DFF77|nr:hypothetical protein [Gordonia sp. CNJ-863]OLT42966.1 hypothetical protein BJF87_08750 [Gordonia sp. CNJ-863]